MRTAAATSALQDSAGFNHKATLVLASRGVSRDAIAALLGISTRTVRRYLNTPCEAYEVERQEVHKRERWELLQRTKYGRAPVNIEPYLVERDLVDAAEAVWLGEDFSSYRTREKVRRYLVDGQPPAMIARLLGISRQAVSGHVKALRDGV